MKKTVIAVDPTTHSGKSFERFCAAVRFFQDKGLFGPLTVASVFSPAMTPLPFEVFSQEKTRILEEALTSIKSSTRGRFKYDSAQVLYSESPSVADHVAKLSDFSKKSHADLLVFGSHERSGLPYWFLGKFSETAALTAGASVFIIKPYLHRIEFSREPRILVAVDASSPPSKASREWIVARARSLGASLDLASVSPKPRFISNVLEKRSSQSETEKVLGQLQRDFESKGLKTKIHLLEEGRSIAHSLVELAESRKAWIIATTAADRSLARKLLLGSRARQILTLTKRPFLSVRPN